MDKTLVISDSIVGRCIKGDTSAYNEVYKSCAKGVFNAILRIVKNREEAEDLLQETFMSAFQSMPGYRGDASLYGWIKRIGVNKSLNAIKKRRESFGYLETDMPDAENEESGWEEMNLTAAGVAESLEKLPEGFRIVLTLYLFEDYSHKEIAAELGITESTSKSQYLRGKRKLKELILASHE